MNKSVSAGETWLLSETTALDELTLQPGGIISAPAEKTLTLTVDGVGTPLLPGTYRGNVVLTVCHPFVRRSQRFGEVTDTSYRMGVCVLDGHYLPQCSVSAIVQGGTVDDSRAAGMVIRTNEADFNGIYVTGTGEYTVEDVEIHLAGEGTNDFVGLGAGIAAAGSATLTVNRANIFCRGITRGTVFVGGESTVVLNDCQLHLEAPVPTQAELDAGRAAGRMMEPVWAMGVRGYGRAVNLADRGTLYLNQCRVTSNSWGVLSVDGATVNRMMVDGCVITLTGDSGYGAFSIADDVTFDYQSLGRPGCYDIFSLSVINVPTYAAILSLGTAWLEYTDGCIINSKRFGVLIFRNCGQLLVNGGTVMNTEKACFLVKGSNCRIDVDNARLRPRNGVLLQLMDNDDTGMEGNPFLVPFDADIPVPGRDLTRADAQEDVFLRIANTAVTGDCYNATTNRFACCRRPAEGAIAEMEMDFGQVRGIGKSLQGAKNLELTLENATLTGHISAATAAYREGVTIITQENCEELGEVTCTPAPAVNNGIILRLEGKSRWNLPGSCYLTSLTIGEHSALCQPVGTTLTLTVNGTVTPLRPGTYTGQIALLVE